MKLDAIGYHEESDSGSRFRVIRAIKNRFGAVNELGMFAMTGSGLKEVKNPSAIFLSGHDQPVSGSVITVVREGTRPILLEVQALVIAALIEKPGGLIRYRGLPPAAALDNMQHWELGGQKQIAAFVPLLESFTCTSKSPSSPETEATSAWV